MTWEPNETTRMVIDDYLKTMKEELPWLLQITEFIQGCTVEDLDPYSVGLNTWPRLIRVKLRGEYNTDVWYREEMGLIVTDDVTVVRLREGEQYEIFRIGGSTGAGTGGVVYANPTASVGLAPVNGVLATAMRSDGAPQLSQTIAPTWTGVHTHAQDVILDDGVLNSPLLRFVGGSNDDEAFIYLDDDIILNASDLVISLVDNLGDSMLKINDSGGNTVITFDSNGGAVFNERNEDADFRIEGTTEPNLLFVDASTNAVGVGTGTPGLVGHMFDVYKSQSNTTAMMVTNPGVLRFSSSGIKVGELDTGAVATGRLGEFNYFNNSWNPAAGNEALVANGAVFRTMALATGGLNFVVNAVAPIRFFTGGQAAANEKMRLDANDRVGIGVTGPAQKLHVFGRVYAQNYSTPNRSTAFQFFGGDTGGVANYGIGMADVGSQGFLEYSAGTSSNASFGHRFWINGNVVMEMEGTGNIGIGIVAPVARLHVDQPSTTAAIPTLILDQADLSEEFIEFRTTIGGGNPIELSTLGSYYGKIRIGVAGVGYKYLAIYNS